jgi:hypothetical protein
MIIKKRNRSGILCYWDDVLNASNVKSRKEKCEQIDLNSFCKADFSDIYPMMWHTVNEGKRDSFYGAMLSKRGKKPGIPDWVVLIPAPGYTALLIELKRSRKSDSSIPKEERDFILIAEKFGVCVVVAYGYIAALEAINDYFSNKIKHNS